MGYCLDRRTYDDPEVAVLPSDSVEVLENLTHLLESDPECSSELSPSIPAIQLSPQVGAIAGATALVVTSGMVLQLSEIYADAEDQPVTASSQKRDREAHDLTSKIPAQLLIAPPEVAQTPNQACAGTVCEEIQALETQLPQSQQRILTLRHQIRQLQHEQGVRDIVAEGKAFSDRVTAISEQSQAIAKEVAHAQQQYVALQQQLNLRTGHPLAVRILNHNLRYRTLLQQLTHLDHEMAVELGQITVDATRLKPLQTQYQSLLTELNQEAQRSLILYVTVRPEHGQQPIALGPEMLQESPYLSALQHLVQTAHQLQVLSVRQQHLQQLGLALNQQRQHWVALLQQYSDLWQELQTATATFEQQRDRLATLRNSSLVALADF
jgi:hypothetical protein